MEQKNYQELLSYIDSDHDENRITARVFFINNLEKYFDLVNELKNRADYTVRLSDDSYCKGDDTVPNLKAVIEFLDSNRDKNILIPHVAEYLRVGESIERNSAYIYSILNRHVHSRARVWIPIFSAKSLFQSIIGKLDEERFGDKIFEVTSDHMASSTFRALAYSTAFSKYQNLISANGIKSWLKLWDDNEIRSGMSFTTRHIKQISPTGGEYELSLIQDPYEYLCSIINEETNLPEKSLGTDEEWASLIPYAEINETLENLILKRLNEMTFDFKRILGNWPHNSEYEKWCLFLWYKTGLNTSSNYLSFALQRCENYSEIPKSIEMSIMLCIDNPLFDRWSSERLDLLKLLAYGEFSSDFWKDYHKLDCSARKKMKLLSGITHREKAEIIMLVSEELKAGKNIIDFEKELKDKFPSLLTYMENSKYLKGALGDYFIQYKAQKIKDEFVYKISELAGDINYLDYDTRGSILYAYKKNKPYYIWIDGMGVEWLDLLIKIVLEKNNKLKLSDVKIGTATIPTVTSVNMEKADKETISEKKFDDFDSISHIKDKSDCNYFSVMVKQLEMMDIIANRICESAKNNPGKKIIVTSDHGMSRMAAKAFHETEGVEPPKGAEVNNHGRYCIAKSGKGGMPLSNTVSDGDIIAFCTHNHFKMSGYAPGETHGGASPEEILVPVIVFENEYKTETELDKFKKVDYCLVSSNAYIEDNGETPIYIKTMEKVASLTIEVNGIKYKATSIDNINWSARVLGLLLDHTYVIFVYPNNIFLGKTDSISVKRKGLLIDDDF